MAEAGKSKKKVAFAPPPLESDSYEDTITVTLNQLNTHDVNHGYALIINHLKFNNPHEQSARSTGSSGDQEALPERCGTEHDVRNLSDILSSKFGFIMAEILQDCTAAQLRKKLKDESHAAAQGPYDCVLVVTLTHGDGGGQIYTSDSRNMTVQDIMDPFLNHESLTDIPKVFVFQACRGTGTDAGRMVRSPTEVSFDRLNYPHQPGVPDSKSASMDHVAVEHPNQPNVLVAYSTVEDNECYRQPETGTFYIQSLCTVLKALHSRIIPSSLSASSVASVDSTTNQSSSTVGLTANEKDCDLVRVLTAANRELTNKTVKKDDKPFKQTGSFTSSLTCRLMLKAQ